MTTSSSICLFHDRRYSSNIQHILNLLRINIIKIKCDLNMTGKRSLCTCKLSSDQMLITDEEFNEKQKEFEEIQTHQYLKEINQIIQLKIMKTCDSKMSIYKLLKLICDIFNDKIFPKLSKPIRTVNLLKSNHRNHHSNLIRRHIELSLTPNQIGHLIGRDGHLHKNIMNKTKTRIHFNNIPYSINSSSKQSSEFNLDLFQSSDPLKATITGDTIEAVEDAAKALEKLVQTTQNNLSRLHNKSNIL